MSDRAASLSKSRRELLARALSGGEPQREREAETIRPRDPAEKVPVAPEQMNIWLHAALAPNSPLYNEPITIRLPARIDPDALERSLNEFVRRHELWRTSFKTNGSGIQQIVHADLAIRLRATDLSRRPDFHREAEASRIAAADARVPLNPGCAPLIRARLVKFSESEHRLYLTLHHLIFDGVSLTRVFLPELAAIYEAYREDREHSLPPPKLQYGDYAAWRAQGMQSGKSGDDDIAWWRSELSGELPVLNLGTNRERGAGSSHVGGMERFEIPEQLVSRLKALSRSQGVTLYATLLAAYSELLHRRTGQEDMLIGGVTDTRSRPELANLLGCFLNTIVLRTRPGAGRSFRQFLSEVQDTVLSALDHNVTFDRVIADLRARRLGTSHPLFQAMFSMQPPAVIVPGWDLIQMDVITGSTKFDLYLELEERAEGLLGRFLYAADLFEADTIRDLVREWTTILELAVENPDFMLGRDGSNRKELVAQTTLPESEGRYDTFMDWFKAQANATPNAVALEFEGRVATYRELDRQAEALAHDLQALGVGPEKLVAIALDRSFELVVRLLAILKAGAAYLPLDPFLPQARIQSVLQDAKPDLLMVDADTDQTIAECGIPRMRCVSLPTTVEFGNQGPKDQASKPNARADNLAYVIYTSGSTGKPKGVEVCHHSLVNLLVAMKRRFELGAKDKALAINTLSFDFSVAELFLPLVSGARLIIASRDDAADPKRLKALIDQSCCTLLQATPATWRGLIASGWSGRTPLTIVSGGEALPVELGQRLLRCGSNVWNVYGPTETTVFAVVHKLSARETRISIGRPIDNVSAHIIDQKGELVHGEGEGELYIGGPGVARGYRNDHELTRERFLTLSSVGQARLYRTGDIVRRRGDGALEWLGRTDNQVKVRGFRIGLEEIEAALQAHPKVIAAAVRAWPDASGGMSLCAYVVHNGEPDLVRFGLRVFLREKLPDYMVPSRFVALDKMPLTSSEKIDRQKLPEPRRHGVQRKIDDPRNDREKSLTQIWSSLLRLPQVGIHDNFFDLGGHSVLAFMMIAEIKAQWGLELPLSVVLSNPTIAQLAEVMEAGPPEFSYLAPFKKEGSGNPLFIVHGAFGNILVFKRFSERIETKRPIYALQASGTHSIETLERSIDEMSDAYIAAIRTVQPSGPYSLTGYSFGGLIAFEMARKLRATGELVEFLGIIDTYVHHRNLPLLARLVYYLSLPVHLLQKLATLELRLWPSYLRRRSEMLYRRVLLRFMPPGTVQGLRYDWSEVMPESSERMYEVALREYLSFRLRPFDGIVSFFRASRRSLVECDPLPAWRNAAGRLEVHDVRGDHGTILEEDVDCLARELSLSLANVEASGSAPTVAAIRGRKPRVLVATMVHWPSTVRLCMALKEAGFEVAAIAPARHGLGRLSVCSEIFSCSSSNGTATIMNAIRTWSPDFIIPADERAVRCLHRLHANADGDARVQIRSLIEHSLGDPSSYVVTTSRAAFMALAKREGILVPDTCTLAALHAGTKEQGEPGQDERARMLAPLVLKLDGTSGGEGVRIAGSSEALLGESHKLTNPSWLDVAKEILITRSYWPVRERLHRAEQEIAVQKFIPGRCANRAVVCWRGEVLAGISVEAVETARPTGPSTVVRIVENPDMESVATKLVRKLGLSGFCGFDFVIEQASGKPVLIEINPRPTPSCHLALGEKSDMAGALFAQITNSPQRSCAVEKVPEQIAYFPQELWRDPSSRYLKQAFHDVPWEEPRFIEMYFEPHRGDWLVQFALKVRNLWPESFAGKVLPRFIVAKDR